MANKDRKSIFLSLVLRHKPEVIGLALDKNGWANVDELIEKMSINGRILTLEELQNIVKTDSKGRYKFSEDGSKIRANQGHSIDVDVELRQAIPPDILYHGTTTKFISSIKSEGIIKGKRLYVHLSQSYNTAVTVAKRHGTPVVLSINTKQMTRDGYTFYLSENKVWLVDEVPSKYIIEK